MDKAPEGLLPAGKIRVLPEGLANRIAAGEVVERPASVVKELIENSLDAEAGEILVAVRKAGLEEILVADNGWGMDEEDLVLAFRRHATSKLSKTEDLQRITHLGFRGEALPSVASVARVEVVSRRGDRDSGCRYRVEGGKSLQPEPAARERGTTVRVRSLFYNVPARRKFLRTPGTEYNHIVNVFKRYALAYPELRWTLRRNEEVVWDFPPTDLAERVGQLFGKESVKGLLNVNNRAGNIFVQGVIGGEALLRRSRGDQYLFVNRRPFVNSSLHHAVVNAFGPLLQPGQVPMYVLFLRLDPEEFDVNVHPAKHEVRFRDERLAYRAVLFSVRDGLGDSIRRGDSPVSLFAGRLKGSLQKSEIHRPQGRKIDGRRELELLFGKSGPGDEKLRKESNLPPPGEGGGNGGGKDVVVTQETHTAEKAPSESEVSRHDVPRESPASREYDTAAPLAGKYDPHLKEMVETPDPGTVHESTRPAAEGEFGVRTKIWQLHRTYILSQVKSGLVIIDQHVAHERILFERALAALRDKPWGGQRLLFPVEVKVDPGDSVLLEEISDRLARLGFETEHLGDDTWRVLSIPAGLRRTDEAALLKLVLADYRVEHELKLAPEESLAASFACKAAIKKGDALNLEEMNALIDELFLTRYPFVCPHGRPIVVNLTLKELDKLFGRG